MLEAIINLLFPKVCGICKNICNESICPKCKYNLKKIEKCKIQKIKGKNFEDIAYVFDYKGIIRDRIIEYKFSESGYLYRLFSDYMIKNKKINNFIKNYDIIIPVPVHKKRKKQRGYNQTELIAKAISKELNIKLEIGVLIKTKNTKPQSTLSKVERKNNAKGVYEIQNKEKIYGKKVLLLDDIYTTGSTVNECSKVLKLATPSKIGVITIAKD